MGLTAYNPWRTTAKPMPKNQLEVMGPPLLYPPALGNLAAWYDAQDISSMVLDSANRVSLWMDKSGNSNVNCLVLNGVAGNYASVPDSAGLSITGELDIIIDLALVDYTPSANADLVAKRTPAGGFEYSFRLLTTGLLDLYWHNGTGFVTNFADAATSIADGSRAKLRVTREVNGANYDIKYYKDIGNGYEQIGSTISVATAGNAPVDSAQVLTIGGSAVASTYANGIIYNAQIYDGIAGTLVLDADFSTAGKLVGSFVCSTGQTVTINSSGATGARISGARDLYQGTAANQPIYLPWSGSNYGWLNGVGTNYFSAPDSAALSFSTAIGIAAKLSTPDYTPAASMVIAAKEDGAATRSYRFALTTTGALFVMLSADGSSAASTATSSEVVPFGAGDTGYVAFDWRQSDGRVRFFTSTDGANWTQLGTDQSIIIASIADTASIVEIGRRIAGTEPFAGNIYSVSFSDSFQGTVVASFDASAYTSGPTLTAATGEVWTVNGGAHIVTRTGLYFDGSNDYLKTAAFSLSQPESVYLVGEQTTWTTTEGLFDGNSINTMLLRQFSASPTLAMFAGNALEPAISTAVLKTTGIITAVFNGVSSVLRFNRLSPVTGNPGSAAGGGLTLGARGDVGVPANIFVSELPLYSAAHDQATQARLALYSGRKWRFTA